MPVTNIEAAAEIRKHAEDLRRYFTDATAFAGLNAPMTVGDGERVAILIEDLARILAQTPENHVRAGIHGILADGEVPGVLPTGNTPATETQAREVPE